ncbi:hypothetical protein [Streptomyces prasinus]|uniref:DUF98 domain-containing protein n=1 Tax=Streptomyces prasinus TaxID=67345 RepID=A0ABX6AYN0_9ACTN|nr:hypothetical protein [Streptomyces prasinus]QEV06777.1 hypothetical protein CP972_14900 [Streptomyces prasinus]
MTTVPPRTPPPAPAPGPDRRITEFASSRTRMLLAGDGLTTVLLEAAARAPLHVRITHVARLSAHALDDLAPRTALELDAGRPCLLRRTRLVTPAGVPVSANVVVAAAGRDADVDAVMPAPHPLGYALADRGRRLERRLLHVGRAAWPEAPDQICASKTYVMCHAGEPLVFVREMFSPAYFPAGTDGTATAHEARPANEARPPHGPDRPVP